MSTENFSREPRQRWKRKNYDLQYLHGKSWRERAEIETTRDLSKSTEQLVCDFHDIAELALTGRPPVASNPDSLHLHAEKRMVSLMGKVALAHERSSRWLVRLTFVLVAMTAVLIWLTVVLIMFEKHPLQ